MDEIVNVRVSVLELAGRIGPPELGDRDAHYLWEKCNDS
jgi:hypothetical protein